jgi:hypothetical protein
MANVDNYFKHGEEYLNAPWREGDYFYSVN